MPLGDRPLTRHAPKSSCPALCRASTSFLGAAAKTWMAGPSPAMTAKGSRLEGWGGACPHASRRIAARFGCGSRQAAMLLSMRARRGRCRRWTKNQPAGVRKWRGGGVPVSGLLFTGSCATAARGEDTRIEIRCGRFPRSRLSARCAGSAGMSEREATCECRNGSRFLTFTGIYRQRYTTNVWRVTRGQKRVEDARRRVYDPRVHPSSPNFAKRDGLHRNSGWRELRTFMRRKSGKPDLHRNSAWPELRTIECRKSGKPDLR
jgi:hypothetical protein